MEVSCRIVVLFTLALLLLSLSAILYIRHHIYHNIHETLVLRRKFHISEACLQCICEVGTECELSTFESGDMCGSFRISQSYWIDAGLPMLEGAFGSFPNSDLEYLRCVNNLFCAARTVSSYVGKHLQDCDGNGVINCYDYAKIHMLGHTNCSGHDLPPLTAIRVKRCLEEFSVI